MSQRIKLIAFCFCLLTVVSLATALVVTPGYKTPLRKPDGTVEPIKHGKSSKYWSLIPVGLSLAGAVVLLIDAFRREYEGPKALPVALALMGILTIGFTSALYYAIWGWMPTKREHALAQDFCSLCTSETLEKNAPGTGTINGVFGLQLMGAAYRCETCGSSVKTLWLLLLLPVIPFGSYRVLPVGTATYDRARYISRKMPRMNWYQVLPLLSITTAVACLVVYMANR